jgi:cob(I)alamin adenosyltransferase
VALGRTDGISALSIQYLNRLSDQLFLAARTINAAAGAAEPPWKPGREGKPQ